MLQDFSILDMFLYLKISSLCNTILYEVPLPVVEADSTVCTQYTPEEVKNRGLTAAR